MKKSQGEIMKDDNKKPYIAVEGMGADAKVETNEHGGMQSEAPHAFHLLDPYVTLELLDIAGKSQPIPVMMDAFKMCLDYMGQYQDVMLIQAMANIEPNVFEIISTVAKRLQYGATKGNGGKGYPVNNWRLIPREQHLNHAMNHIFAMALGDEQDDHKSAAICRLHMALATKESPNFKYQEFVEKTEEEKPTVLEKMQAVSFNKGELSPELKTNAKCMEPGSLGNPKRGNNI